MLLLRVLPIINEFKYCLVNQFIVHNDPIKGVIVFMTLLYKQFLEHLAKV